MHRWIGILAGIIIAVAITVLLVIGPTMGNVDNFKTTLAAFGPWAVLISAGLTVGQAIVAPLPANVITMTNALVFGPVWGSLLSWFSTVLGSSLCFLLSKKFGKPFAEKIVGNSLQSAEKFFKTYGLHAMFLIRIMPFVPFDAVSYGAPLVGIPFSRFLVATSIGIIPSILIYSYLGTVIAGIYWYVLIGLLTASLIAIIATAKVLRRVQASPKIELSKTVA